VPGTSLNGHRHANERDTQRLRVGIRHADGAGMSRSLDANCARDRHALTDLVLRTNESLREHGHRAMQKAEAARRKMLQVAELLSV
jgi:hypothetical protein